MIRAHLLAALELAALACFGTFVLVMLDWLRHA